MIVCRPIAERMKSLIISRVGSDDDDDVNCGEFHESLRSPIVRAVIFHICSILHFLTHFWRCQQLATLLANATFRPRNFGAAPRKLIKIKTVYNIKLPGAVGTPRRTGFTWNIMSVYVRGTGEIYDGWDWAGKVSWIHIKAIKMPFSSTLALDAFFWQNKNWETCIYLSAHISLPLLDNTRFYASVLAETRRSLLCAKQKNVFSFLPKPILKGWCNFGMLTKINKQ